MTLASSPEHSGLTGDDLEAYLASRLGPILQPNVPDQKQVTRQFTAGTGGTPPNNVDETGGSTTLETPPTYEPESEEDDGDDEEYDDGEDDGDEDEVGEGAEEPEEETEPDGEARAPSAEPAEPPVTSVPDQRLQDQFEIAPGQWVSREHLAALLRFDQMLVDDPELRGIVENQIRQHVGVEPGTPVPQPPVEFPEEYADDPAFRAILQRLDQQQSLIAQQQEMLSNVDATVHRQQQEETQARFIRVSNQFAQDHDLTPEQLDSLSNVAARLNVIEPLVRGTDPLTGQPAPRDPDQWIQRALEIAYWSIPEYRDKEYGKQVNRRAKDQRRKQRLAGVGGSSGSVPRVTPVPSNETERLAAARRELAEMMGRSEE